MKVDSSLTDRQKEVVIGIAKDVGLDQINFDETYFVTKVDQLKPNPNGIPDSGLLVIGKPTVLGPTQDNKVVLLIQNENILEGWLRTSPVNRVFTSNGKIFVQTENSTYMLQTSLSLFRDQF